jgi:Sec-independent protein secretion pathway component TatC
MAVMQLVLFTEPHLTPDHAAYWFLMQIGMVLGFLTAYPVNVWLIRRGVKEAMYMHAVASSTRCATRARARTA